MGGFQAFDKLICRSDAAQVHGRNTPPFTAFFYFPTSRCAFQTPFARRLGAETPAHGRRVFFSG